MKIAVLALAGVALSASRARAQGYGVYEQDACTMGRAGTGVAAPCNASAIFYNPAGIQHTGGNKWDVVLGGVLIRPSFGFHDSVSGATTSGPVNNNLAPHFYITRQLSHGWAVGFGAFAAYGLVSEWPTTFSGRFLGYRSEIKTGYFQPTIAKKVNSWLDIGAGVDYIRTLVDLRQRVDLSSQTAAPGVTFGNLGIPLGTDFANAELHGTSWSSAGHFGVMVHPWRRISLGLRYMMKSTADIQGAAYINQVSTGIILPAGNPIGVPGGTPLDSVVAPQFRGSGPLNTPHASTNVALPDQLVAGVSVKVTNQLTLLGDYQWVHWAMFQQLTITTATLPTVTLWQDFKNTSGFRLGAEYEANNQWMVRAGLLYHQGASPDNTVTPLLPEGARAEQTLGVSYRLNPHTKIEAAYQHLSQQDRRGRVVNAPRGQGALFNTGVYTGSANLFGVSLVWGR
ncbi:MAG TPA: outer membrane protein transport protein [Gemmatimonadales bacterium]